MRTRHPEGRGPWWSVTLLIGGASGLLGSLGGAASELPPIECVRALRSASVARFAAAEPATAAELELLRAAETPCDGYPNALAAQLQYADRAGLDPADRERLSARLIQLLEDPEYQLSISLGRQLVGQPGLDPALLERVSARIERLFELGEIENARREDALRLLADTYLRTERDDQLVETLEQLREVAPSEDVLWRLVRTYRERGDAQLAAERFAEIVRDSPALSSALLRLRVEAGDREALMEEYRRVADMELPRQAVLTMARAADADVQPLDTIHHSVHTLAWHLRDLGLDREAEVLFRKLLEAAPQMQTVRRAVAFLYVDDEAERRRLLAADGAGGGQSDPVELANQAADRLAAGDYQGAFDRLIRLRDEHAEASVWEAEPLWLNLGIAAYRTEQWQAAADAYGRAVQFNAARAQSQLFYGMALAKLERWAEAVAPLDRALELDPTRYTAHYQLWVCHRSLGNADAAARHRAAWDGRPQ